MIAYLNGKYIPSDKLRISVFDRGFLYGHGVFETMRSYGGVPFLIEKHMKRLSKSLAALHIRPKVSVPEIKRSVFRILEVNRLSSGRKKDAYVKIIITGGASRGIPGAVSAGAPTVCVYAFAYRSLPARVYEKGISVNISEKKLNAYSGIAGHKTLNYLVNILALDEARKGGLRDSVFLNTEGYVTEASSSNIFLVKKGRLLTPPPETGILPGITRAEVMRLARRHGYKVREVFFRESALCAADEAFITNSLSGILPVVKIGRKKIGRGRPGPRTAEIMKLYENSVKNYCAPRGKAA